MFSVVKSIALFVAIVVALLAVPLLFMSDDAGKRPAESIAGAPWQIEILPDGTTRVFGLIPGRSTLDDARRQFGPDTQIALILAPGETGSVEAFYDKVSAGSVTGKMILTLETTVAQRERMLKRARKAEYMESSTRRVELGEDDLLEAGKASIAAIGFIPSANLDPQIVLQRFGTPAERLRSSEQTEHFLYPDKGLDLRLDTKGRELLQYVAPREFPRLRDPLVAAATK
ncbi:MAG: hypothetical protein Q8L56_01505 [Rhodocyclaceae bacterium]|nr:hypothetical protein [Rhodocyclaceae bacterium]